MLQNLGISDYEYENMLDAYDVIEDIKQLHKKAEGVLMGHLLQYSDKKKQLTEDLLQRIVAE